ncbi:HTH_38 domain-containing protein [Trichonephila clavipes]|nr:HTH_38 domain-containing protein [Trichonephila clavipes]
MRIISIIAQTHRSGDRSVTRKCCVRSEQIGYLKQRASFDQVSEFDRRRIVAYRDCALSFREIGQRVGRNQATVRRICHRWMQEDMTDRQGQSHPPHCTIACDGRWIERMAVIDCAVSSSTTS